LFCQLNDGQFSSFFHFEQAQPQVSKYLRDPLISAVKLFVENNKTIMLNEKQNEQPK